MNVETSARASRPWRADVMAMRPKTQRRTGHSPEITRGVSHPEEFGGRIDVRESYHMDCEVPGATGSHIGPEGAKT